MGPCYCEVILRVRQECQRHRDVTDRSKDVTDRMINFEDGGGSYKPKNAGSF